MSRIVTEGKRGVALYEAAADSLDSAGIKGAPTAEDGEALLAAFLSISISRFVTEGKRGVALYEAAADSLGSAGIKGAPTVGDGEALLAAFRQVAESLEARVPLHAVQTAARFVGAGLAAKYTRAPLDLSPTRFAAVRGQPLTAAMGASRGTDGFSLAGVWDNAQAARSKNGATGSTDEVSDELLSQLLWIGTAASRSPFRERTNVGLPDQVKLLVETVGMPRVEDVLRRFWLRADAQAFLGMAQAHLLLDRVEPAHLAELGLVHAQQSRAAFVYGAIASLVDFLEIFSDGPDVPQAGAWSLPRIADEWPREMHQAVVSLFSALVAKELAKGSDAGTHCAASMFDRLAKGIAMLDGGQVGVEGVRQLFPQAVAVR